MSIVLSSPMTEMRIAPPSYSFTELVSDNFLAAREADKDFVLEYAKGLLAAQPQTFWVESIRCRVSIAEAYDLCVTTFANYAMTGNHNGLRLFETVVLMRANVEFHAVNDDGVKAVLVAWDKYREGRAIEHAKERGWLV